MTCSWERKTKSTKLEDKPPVKDEHTILTYNGRGKLQMHNVNRASGEREGRRSEGVDTSSDLLPSCSDLCGAFSAAAGDGGPT